MKNLKHRLQQGETLLGCWLNLGNALTAEIVGLAGFDWVLIDLEHGAGTEHDLVHQLQALEHTPAGAVVRVEGSQRQRIHRVLDLGADGIMCPRVYDTEEARHVVQCLRYPPAGVRGVAQIVRATEFGRRAREYYDAADEAILGVIQIETAEVLRHVDEIAILVGVDVLFIGPSDLSMALGIFGQLDHPLFRDAVTTTLHAAEQAGKAAGILLTNPDDFDFYHDLGMRLIACGADARFVADGAHRLLDTLAERRAAYSRS